MTSTKSRLVCRDDKRVFVKERIEKDNGAIFIAYDSACHILNDDISVKGAFTSSLEATFPERMT